MAANIPEAVSFALLPPSIPGLGAAGGFSFWLQDRSGGSVDFLDQNLQKFLEACRKRPEIGAVNSGFSASVPQIYADVDRDKVLKQGVAVNDVYQTLQAYLGGLFLNQFNRFGRQWRVFLQAEGEERPAMGINAECADGVGSAGFGVQGAEQIVERGGDHGGHREEERKFQRRRARHARQLAGGDGRHGARRAGKDGGENLAGSNPNRLPQVHILHAPDANRAPGSSRSSLLPDGLRGIHCPHHNTADE